MAKRATNSGPTKTQLIQEFYNQGVTSGKDILVKLEEAGQPSTKSMVYTTISKMKRAPGGGKKKSGPRTAAQPAPASNGANGATTVAPASPALRATSGGSVSLADLAAITELAKRIGGVEQLRRVLESLASLG